jgi:hypothetical protein
MAGASSSQCLRIIEESLSGYESTVQRLQAATHERDIAEELSGWRANDSWRE